MFVEKKNKNSYGSMFKKKKKKICFNFFFNFLYSFFATLFYFSGNFRKKNNKSLFPFTRNKK